MKLYSILFEGFTFEPRNMDLFISNLTKRISAAEVKIDKLMTEIDNLLATDEHSDREDKEYYFDRILHLSNDKSYDLRDLKWVVTSLKYSLHIHGDSLAENISRLYGFIKSAPAEQRYRSWDFYRYIVQALKHVLEDYKNYESVHSALLSMDVSEVWEEYKEFFVSDQIVKNTKLLLKEIENLIKLVEYSVPKLERVLLRGVSYSDKDLKHKNVEAVELLYHATVNATQLAQTGFKKDLDQKAEGLGGSNKDEAGNPAISFTADLYVAKEVARTLKEAIMIAKGEIDIYDLKTLAMQAGVDKEIESMYGWFAKEENLAAATPKETFDYYKLYLLLSKRYDPVFFDSGHLMKVFKTKNVEDVGILVCKVDMTDPNIKYLHSMEEYRVSPKSVLSIEKVLK